jgi:hypothetical protein
MTINEVDIKHVSQVDINSFYSPFSGPYTYTTLFLQPGFDVKLDETHSPLFINSFLNDYKLTHKFEKPLFFLIKTQHLLDPLFVSINSFLNANKNFVFSYPIGMRGDEYLFMYVFQCPEKFHEDYDLFMMGKYSHFSPDFKNRFEKKVLDKEGKTVDSPIYGVIHKTDKTRKKIESIIGEPLGSDQEYFGTLYPHLEIFRYPHQSTKTINHEPSTLQATELRTC